MFLAAETSWLLRVLDCYSYEYSRMDEGPARALAKTDDMAPARDMLFLSHANPEDNEFTLWLALQLAKEGYPVWCDLTKLLGGERFWTDIEKAIRQRTGKFLYVLSATSNEKDGPRRELQLAQSIERTEKLSDFIIPLHIDALPFSDANILLQGIMGISFKSGWQAGLGNLLRKLNEEGIPKKPGFSPAAVGDWWRSNCSPDQGIQDKSEIYYSNWFGIAEPPRFYIHSLRRSGIGLIECPASSPVPVYQDGISLFSFALADELEPHLRQSEVSISDSTDFGFWEYVRQVPDERARRKRENCLSNLIRIAWERSMAARNLQQHSLANRASCSYFTSGFAPGNVVSFTNIHGKPSDRAMIGFKTVGGTKRYWHFAFSCRVICRPMLACIVKSHVVFSDDAKNVWKSASRLHSARRSQCKNWWNPVWRDRVIAATTWLTDGDGLIRIPVASGLFLEICGSPVRFESPVAYHDPQEEVDSALPPDPADGEDGDSWGEMEDDDESQGEPDDETQQAAG
ncbi:MAG: toll/interleukin-1 receptor domain-containing protein [Bryobacteraceae bacterium]